MSRCLRLAVAFIGVSFVLVGCAGPDSTVEVDEPASADPVATGAVVDLAADEKTSVAPALPEAPGCYWIAPEQGAARVAAAGGLELSLAAVGPLQGSHPQAVEIFFETGSDSARGEDLAAAQGEQATPLARLDIGPGERADCSTACVTKSRLEGGLPVGAGLLLARFYSKGGELLCEASNAVQVNAPPEIEGLRVDPAEPEAATNVHFEVNVSDPDGDELVLFHAWRHESGREIHERVLEGRETRPGEKWTLEFSAQDPFERAAAELVEFSIKLPEAQTARFCEPGSRLQGLGPPWDDETWCEKQDGAGEWQHHGFHRRWWSAAKDLIKSEEEWRDGQKNGRWTSWYENSKKSYEASWSKGSLNGPAMAWHDNGSRSAEYSFRDGEKHGLEVNWYREGGEQYRMEGFVSGRKEGVETRWHRNGNKQEETHWKDGRRHGNQIIWHPHGAVLEERSYVKGKRHGTWQRWHANGVRAAEGHHEHGRPIGEWLRWNENGDIEDGEALP